MSGRKYMPIFWGDYLADTLDLTLEEHGAYCLLIAYYWQSGGPLEYESFNKFANKMQKIWKLSRFKSHRVWEKLSPYFEIRDG